MSNNHVTYKHIECSKMSEKEIYWTSLLFSENYGIWSEASPHKSKRKERIRLSPERIKELFVSKPDRYVIMAFVNGELAGHIFYLKRKGQKNNPIIFVLQLVVAEKFRNQKIATRMMTSIWQLSNCYAWGLFTSNPKTVKVLEEATMRKVNVKMIGKKIDKIREIVYDVFDSMDWIDNYENGIVSTDFYVDHGNLQKRIDSVYEDDAFSLPRDLPEGKEWLAVTFKSQHPMFSSEEEWQRYLDYSQADIVTAYSNMRMEKQSWAKHTKAEIDYLTKKYISNQDYILDYGCGIGRHTNELDNRGYKVLGIDFSEKNIKTAISTSNSDKNIFICADVREYRSTIPADIVLCLYDVIGSFPNQNDNLKILKSANKSLKKGGKIILSVMNMELTENKCINVVDTVRENIDVLLSLPSSNTMQNTGDIFDGSKILIEKETGIIYRKEQFTPEDSLPCELIVRDRRYTVLSIQQLLQRSGFEIIETRFFQAGRMNKPLDSTSSHAKELLVVAQKPIFWKRIIYKFFLSRF